MLGSDEGIKMGFFDGEVLVNIIGNVDGITLGIDVRTDLVSLDEYFDGCKGGNIEGLFLGDSQ